MMAILDFLVKANVVFTVLFAVYYLLLRREKFLVGNRLVLLAIFLLSLILPLCPNLVLAGITSSRIPIEDVTRFLGSTANIGSTATMANRLESVEIYSVLITAYLTVVIFLLAKLMLQVLKIFRVVNKSSRRKMNGVVCCEPADELPPFSFFRYMMISQKALTEEQYRDILAHEFCHCKQLHSIDVLLAELACSLFWFNPFIFVYRYQVKLNLEFLADEHVLGSGADRKHYQLSLVSFAMKKPLFNLSNAFGSSKIKQRIGMMNTRLPHAGKQYKYAVLMAMTLLLYVLMNAEQTKSALNRKIFIDARTSTVRFTEGPVAEQVESEFKGIYVVKGKIYTKQQIRDLLSKNGQLEFTFSNPPVLGFYTSNDATAIQKWGNAARDGAIFLEAKNILQ